MASSMLFWSAFLFLPAFAEPSDDIDFTTCDVTGKLAALDNAASNETYQVVQAANGLADEMFAVGVGQPNALPFMWRRPDGATAPARRISFRVRVPRGFRLVDASLAARGTIVRKDDADGTVEATFRLSHLSQMPRREFLSFSRQALLVDADGPVGSEGDLTLEVLLDDRIVSNRMKTRLKAVEPVRVARKPRRFGAGGHLGGHYYLFSEDSSTCAFAKTLGEAGFDWAITSRTNAVLKVALRAAGFRHLIYDYYWAADGFRVGDPKGRPEADKWVQGDDEKIKNPTDNLSCPMAVYEERAFFLKNSVPKMRRNLEGFDGMWGNWEPEPYRGHGCACSNCIEAARAAGVPLPQFRAEQMAKVVRTVDRHVRAATGGEKSFGFIPAVNWILASTDKIFYDRGYEFWPGLYAKDLKCINPWGPYLFWDTQWRYNPKNHDGMLVEQFVAAKDVRECVDREYPAERRPYLMGFPHADESSRGGNLWIVPPSWIDLAVSSQFFNRWEASVLYYFPRGNDTRYLKAFARAVARAAEYEPFVWDGRRVDDCVKAIATPATHKVRPKFRWNMRKYTNMPFLQTAAYDLGGERIVAAFNFSGLDAVDFDLSQTGLDGSYALSADGVRQEGTTSAAELERGLRLTLPPNTCRVYRFTKL